MKTSASAVSVVLVGFGLLAASCGPSTPAPPKSPLSGSATPQTGGATPVSDQRPVVAYGFSYDPTDTHPGFEDVVTVRLGNRLRLYNVTPDAGLHWTPATLAFLDDDDRVLACYRLDLPPAGSIIGAMPETDAAYTKVRLTLGVGAAKDHSFEPRIGVAEVELSHEHVPPRPALDDSGETGPSVVATHTIGLQPVFGTVMVTGIGGRDRENGLLSGGMHTAALVSDHQSAGELATDEQWLTDRVRTAINDARRVPD